ncbi:hypothetical protein [Natronocalculus amylovorans]|uniref:Uncharacterized protein n=1 Tax=Natronocalculus amylovorans TaxID=2917812 RepID=A0AAE3G0C1_9EURY|nr:hypothetical protein [Natronocalculus amylovorans]MCL9818283.1 hypothetical protein [Natronocalculus amylovorans]
MHRTGQNNRPQESVEPGNEETDSLSGQNETNKDVTSSASSASLGRRGYLTLLGVGVTTPMLAGRALSTEDTGYGVSGYGDRVYGDTEEDEDEEVVEDDDDEVVEDEDEEVLTAEPTITKLNLRDTSNPRNPHADLQIDWAASIDDGELALMELWVERHDGVQITVVTEDLDEEAASGVETTRVHQGAGEQYVVRLRMTSGYDTQTTELESIET